MAAYVVHLNLAHVQGNGWQVRDATLKVLWHSAERVDVQLSVASLQLPLPPPLDQIQGLEAACATAAVQGDTVRCENGTLQLQTPVLDRKPIRVRFHYRQNSRAVQFTLTEVGFAGGSIDIDGQFDSTHWQLYLKATALDVAQLSRRLAPFLQREFFPPAGFTGAGSLHMNARLSGHEYRLQAAELSGSLQEFTFSDREARRAGDKLAMTFAATAALREGQWPLRAEVSVRRGQLYLEPVFLEAPDQPLSLSLTGSWAPAAQRLDLTHIRFHHPHTLQVDARLRLAVRDAPHILSARVQAAPAPLGNLYKTYLHPFVIGTALDALHTDGQVSLLLDYERGGKVSAHAAVENVSLDDKKGRYGLHGLTGTLVWTNEASIPHPFSLRWQGGHLYTLALGAGSVTAKAHGNGFRLLEGMTLPVLDGTLHIDSLLATHLGTPQARWEFAGRLAAVSMEALSRALGWPLLSGQISGDIPLVTSAADTVTVDGSLHIHVFDGEVVVHNLRLAQPFSLVPRLSADIDLNNLDLARITGAFSFGTIRGRLSGHVHGLHLQDWQPVAFDAAFATPPGDTSTHTISQKAVDSLSSLGGISGALSRSFLRVFDEFSYDRLGFSCRLRLGVCEMGGLEPANGGYYIVKGGGVPRIDIIGHERRVDWTELIARLRRATQSTGPVLQ